VHDDPAHYRACVAAIKREPLALGALVTTHKIDLLDASRDLFDELEPHAATLGEVSSIAKRGNRLVGKATDPAAGGASLDARTGPGYFGRTGAALLCLGAGGSAAAIALHLLDKPDAADRPRQFTFVNRSPGRLARLEAMLQPWRPRAEFRFICNEDAERNDALVGELPAGSVVINATGMGKDRPGSPLTDAVRFPHGGIAWELNYRGELDFLHQALAQQPSRALVVEDGWHYFLLGWTDVIAHVLDIVIDDATFTKLAAQAEALR
jgi:shikimate 5-dehydrogenase